MCTERLAPERGLLMEKEIIFTADESPGFSIFTQGDTLLFLSSE